MKRPPQRRGNVRETCGLELKASKGIRFVNLISVKTDIQILMTPKPNRLLVSETALAHSSDPFNTVKQKKSFRRLSDILKEPKHVEHWIVKFSDVSLLCEKVGVTNLPISTTSGGSGASSGGSTGTEAKRQSRRSQSIRSRNLYKVRPFFRRF